MSQADNYDDDEHFDPTLLQKSIDRIFRTQRRALMFLRDSETTDALVAKYPKIFARNDVSIDCKAGWFDILDCLCKQLQNYCDHRNSVFNSEKNEFLSVAEGELGYNIQVVATQVKEKFHALRFYTDGGDDVTNEMIMFAEEISARICETCGHPVKEGLRPICSNCNDAHEANHNNEKFRRGDIK